jgi:protein-S-isoprenylcysteine O-methyltransferase Ste14
MGEQMTIVSNNPPTPNRPSLMNGILARFGQIAILIIIQAAILFLAAGRLDWTWAWVFLAIYFVSISVNSAFLLQFNPDTLAERGHAQETRDWDKLVGGLWSLAQFLILPVVAGLDLRFGWTRDISTWWHIVGAITFALGLALFGWAMITNAYFSTEVRIQSDRGQTVCRSGPYRHIRHPGYAGTALQSIAIALLLGSWWAMIPAVIAAGLMTLRTFLEDQTLQAELPGYQDFIREVRYRLIPGIW